VAGWCRTTVYYQLLLLIVQYLFNMSSSSISPTSSSSLEAISDLLLKSETQATPSKDLSMSIGECCRKLETESLPDSDFKTFLYHVHDHIVGKDSAIRSVLLRAIRYGMRTKSACDAIIEHVSQV
jgi:hypothetical protein